MIEILAGPIGEKFRIHKKLPCSKVDYFKTMFEVGFVENTE